MRITPALVTTWILALLVALPVQAQVKQPSATTAVRAAVSAVVSIHVYDALGQKIALGSGFILDDGRIVTNAHVVMGGDRAEVFDFNGALLGTTQYAESISTRVDLAILPKLSRVAGLRLSSSRPDVGERIIVVGAPEGLTNSVSDGIVGAYRDFNGRKVVQITAPISQGSSGGPVVNLMGEVIGVAVSTLVSGQNLNFAVPAADVAALKSSPPGRFAFPADGRAARPMAATPATAPPIRTQAESSEVPAGVQYVGARGSQIFYAYWYGCSAWKELGPNLRFFSTPAEARAAGFFRSSQRGC